MDFGSSPESRPLRGEPFVRKAPHNGWIGQILTLGRVSNLPTVWSNCVAAWAINLCSHEWARAIPDWKSPEALHPGFLWPLLLGASLLYVGGCALNDFCDHKFDARYNPHRPIPSGEISRTMVLGLATLAMVAGAWILLRIAECDLLWVGLLVACVLVYDLVHKHWQGGVVLMGGCRLLLWACAATCGDATAIHPLTWVWGLTLGCYVVGISLFARGEANPAGDPPRVAIFFLFGPPLFALAALIHWNNLDPIRVFLANLVGLLIAWIAFSSILRVRKGEAGGVGVAVSNLLAGICVTDALVVCFCMPMLIAPLLCLNPLALWMQKRFAAT